MMLTSQRMFVLAALATTLAGCDRILGFGSPVVLDGGGADDAHDAHDPHIDALLDAPIDATAACTTTQDSCAGDSLLHCIAGQPPTSETCGWGCRTENGAHCGELAPTGAIITSSDLVPADLATLAAVMIVDTAWNTDTGEITGVRGPGIGVIGGIRFRAGAIAVWSFRSLQIVGTSRFFGTSGVVIVVGEAASINSSAVVSLDDTCAAGKLLGGSAGGTQGAPAAGAGAGANGLGSVNENTGGAGGGNGGNGGRGGAGPATVAPPGGGAFGDTAITTLRGGGGGGAGGGPAAAAAGGHGGPAFQIVSNERITIASSLLADGCGGGASTTAGGGGGAGGTIVLEAPLVSITAGGALSVGGGGGGGGDAGATQGRNGFLASTGAGGSAGSSNGGAGGSGGAAMAAPTIVAGTPGGGPTMDGGGGGGGAGRIRINTHAGTFALDPAARLNPPLSTTGTPTTTTSGMANIQ